MKKLCIIIIIIIILCYNNNTITNESFTDFASDKFIQHYKNYEIKLDPYKKTLTKNNSVVNYEDHFNTYKSRILADNKVKTKYVFNLNGIPTPNYYIYNNNLTISQNIIQVKLHNLQFPIVVKPIDGTYGKDVYMNIHNTKQLKKILTNITLRKQKIMIEEQKNGDVFRILVFNNNIIDVYKKEPAYVVGNGIHTLNDLIIELKLKKKEMNDYMVNKIDWLYVYKQGYKKNNIIPKNTKIILTMASNVNNGAVVTPININDICLENIQLFKKINKVVGLNLNGIDYITYDLKIPYSNYGYVIENNARPGMEGHYLMNPKSMERFVRLIKF
jgi:cyanophycin synthetase